MLFVRWDPDPSAAVQRTSSRTSGGRTSGGFHAFVTHNDGMRYPATLLFALFVLSRALLSLLLSRSRFCALLANPCALWQLELSAAEEALATADGVWTGPKWREGRAHTCRTNNDTSAFSANWIFLLSLHAGFVLRRHELSFFLLHLPHPLRKDKSRNRKTKVRDFL